MPGPTINMTAKLQANAAQRPIERRSFWPGFVLSLVGLLVALFGLGRMTAVEKVSGDLALETEVNIAIAHGGVRFVVEEQPEPNFEVQQRRPGAWPETFPPTAPPRFATGRGRLCIDLTTKEPCPT